MCVVVAPNKNKDNTNLSYYKCTIPAGRLVPGQMKETYSKHRLCVVNSQAVKRLQES